MFKRQRTGSVVCPGCGYLVGVNDDRCYNCGRWNPSMWGLSPLLRSLGQDLGLVYVIMGGSIVVYVITVIASGSQVGGSLFGLFSPSMCVELIFGASGAVPVFGFHRWWTVLSAGWLHGGLLHIGFNMLALRQLAPGTAELYGPGRTAIIYTVAGACGFALSSFMGFLLPGVPILGGAHLTVGASASIFGLFGALVCYSRRTGSRHIGAFAWQYAVMFFIFGFIFPGIDNYAHAGGFAGGYGAARLLDPARPERIDHLVLALVCLAASIAAIVASIVLGLPLMPFLRSVGWC
jgi:rhomboid protease GluP